MMLRHGLEAGRFVAWGIAMLVILGLHFYWQRHPPQPPRHP